MRVRPKQILYLNNKQELQFVELCVAGTGPDRISCHPQASYRVGLLHFYRQGSQGSEVLSDSSVAGKWQSHDSNPGQPGCKAHAFDHFTLLPLESVESSVSLVEGTGWTRWLCWGGGDVAVGGLGWEEGEVG